MNVFVRRKATERLATLADDKNDTDGTQDAYDTMTSKAKQEQLNRILALLNKNDTAQTKEENDDK